MMARESFSSKEEIDTGLASASRIKIIVALAKDPEKWQSLYYLVKELSNDKNQIKRNLSELARIGWIEIACFASFLMNTAFYLFVVFG